MTLIRPLVWPSGVPRTNSRRGGLFKVNGKAVSVAEALGRLDNQLGMMGARNVEVCADFAATRSGKPSQSEAKGADDVLFYIDPPYPHGTRTGRSHR